MQYYEPKNTTAFNSAVDKVSKKLELPFNAVAYEYSLNPKYYTNDYNPDAFADREYSFNINNYLPYSDQKDTLVKVYSFSPEEIEEILASEQFWASQF